MADALRFLIVWPEKEAIIRNLPKAFKHTRAYKNTRVIIDCSEIFIQRPSNLLARNITYSKYKHHNTFKLLVGITPTGAVSFLSKCWGGRVSDKELTINSGFLEQLEHGDQVNASFYSLYLSPSKPSLSDKDKIAVPSFTCIIFMIVLKVMADRGFLIREELLCRGASLVIPAFTKGKNQLSHTEVINSRKISNVRIHVS